MSYKLKGIPPVTLHRSLVTGLLISVVALASKNVYADGPGDPQLIRNPRRHAGLTLDAIEGTLEVYENRAAGSGRKIRLHFVVLPALGAQPKPDPIVVLAGGPGQGASAQAGMWKSSWMRDERDIILLDQRGTGQSNPLNCRMPGNSENVQGYLDPIFEDVQVFRECLAELQDKADLTQYSTPLAADDLDELRAALGYEQFNLYGGSYGTRAALVYMRRHGEHVRTATLMGVAPTNFKNPLYHARGSQRALELTFDACAADEQCASAFPNLRQEFEALVKRLETKPAVITPRKQDTGEPVTLTITRDVFSGGLRYMLYYGATARNVPLFIHQGYEEDYLPFVRQAVQGNRALQESISFGMLLSVTCAEDVAWITEADIEHETANTFTGDSRVRQQKTVCEMWPKANVPRSYTEPVRCNAPTLLISGTLDPVTPPRFGEEAARHLPNSLHLVVPGYHGVNHPRLQEIIKDFVQRGSVEGLDVSGAKEIQLPTFDVGVKREE